MRNVELRCVTYKLSEFTRECIERIKEDRQKSEKVLFGFASEITNTDVIRFLVDQEIIKIGERAAAAAAQEQEKQRKEVKIANQRARRLLKRGSVK
jgi:hypothetical protein